MAVIKSSSPFGSPTRTRALTALALLGDSYPRELARLLRLPLSAVQKGLASLELDGLVAARTMGRTRLYRLDPRYFAGRELRALVLRLADADRGLSKSVGQMRRRPRRTGKPL